MSSPRAGGIGSQDPRDETEVEALIIGAGVCGIYAAIRLREAGHEVVMVERASQYGGTWRANRYPGCACDVPSHLYSFPFALNPDWSRIFAERSEIWDYVIRVAEDHGLPAITKFGTEVLSAAWDHTSQRWHVETDAGTSYAARILVVAVGGPLSAPAIPKIPGLETFEGSVFHSSQWPEEFSATGRKIAVVGTGASAVQFVPEIQPQAAHLTVFQRTPAWIMPRPDFKVGRIQRRLSRFPGVLRAIRGFMFGYSEAMVFAFQRPRLVKPLEAFASWYIRRSVPDEKVRAAVTPTFRLGCKRILLSSAFYPALLKDNVDLVASAVQEVRGGAIIGADGSSREVDTIILGTGFQAQTPPIADRITGRYGATLAEVWAGSPRAYMATSVSGFPNAFYLFGPNSATASAFVTADAQTRYLVAAAETMRRHGLTMVDVRKDEQDAWKEEADRALATTVWNAGGCDSFYFGADGNNSAIWPGSMRSLVRDLSRFPVEAFDTATRPDALTSETDDADIRAPAR